MLKRWMTMAVLCCVAAGAHAELDMTGCVPVKRLPGNQPFDYNDPDKRAVIASIETRHFTRDVEMLVRGNTTFGAMGDIRYMLDISPNHPRVLQSLVRLAIREKSPRPQGTAISVDCYLKRAMDFAPRDLAPPMIYGQYLASQGQPEAALKLLKDAEKLAPDNPNLAYNLGLLNAELKHYDEALAYAQRAYQAGFPLPGLREKLKRAGHWSEPPAVAEKPAAADAGPTAAKPAVAAEPAVAAPDAKAAAVAVPAPAPVVPPAAPPVIDNAAPAK